MCEIPAVDIIGFPLYAQIEGHRRKLHRRAAVHEQHGIFLGDMHQSAQAHHCIIVNRLIGRAAVTHLHHRHTRARTTGHFLLRALQYGERQRGRSGGKIKNTFHGCSSLVFNKNASALY